MRLTNQHHSFSIRFTAYNNLYEEQECEEVVIDESTISTLNVQSVLDELKELINDANDHIVDRLEND